MYIIGYPLMAIVQLLHSIIFIYTLIVVATVVTSWLNADPRNPIVRALHQLTTPVLSRLRRHIPRFGAFDLTPLALIIGLQFIDLGILPIVSHVAQQMLR